MVVAGTTEDKSFVAARVAWTGSGLNLQTERPTPDQIRSAVRRVLTNNSFRTNARRISENFQQYQALDFIAAEIEEQIRLALECKILQPSLG